MVLKIWYTSGIKWQLPGDQQTKTRASATTVTSPSATNTEPGKEEEECWHSGTRIIPRLTLPPLSSSHDTKCPICWRQRNNWSRYTVVLSAACVDEGPNARECWRCYSPKRPLIVNEHLGCHISPANRLSLPPYPHLRRCCFCMCEVDDSNGTDCAFKGGEAEIILCLCYKSDSPIMKVLPNARSRDCGQDPERNRTSENATFFLTLLISMFLQKTGTPLFSWQQINYGLLSVTFRLSWPSNQ